MPACSLAYASAPGGSGVSSPSRSGQIILERVPLSIRAPIAVLPGSIAELHGEEGAQKTGPAGRANRGGPPGHRRAGKGSVSRFLARFELPWHRSVASPSTGRQTWTGRRKATGIRWFGPRAGEVASEGDRRGCLSLCCISARKRNVFLSPVLVFGKGSNDPWELQEINRIIRTL